MTKTLGELYIELKNDYESLEGVLAQARQLANKTYLANSRCPHCLEFCKLLDNLRKLLGVLDKGLEKEASKS
jgi:hypothetical protein